LDELKAKPAYAQGYFFLGELYADTGQRDKAREHLIKAEEMFRGMGMDYWLDKTQEVLERRLFINGGSSGNEKWRNDHV
jgi:hypothetical protein